MGSLVQKVQQRFIKVYERVRRLKKMQQCFTEEQVQQMLRESDAQVIDALLDELAHGCRVRGALPCPREDCEVSLHASTPPPPTPALKKKDGASPGEHGAAPRSRALRMDVASSYVQDHDEDAHFVHAEAGVVGVADGVSAFRKKGVDAGAFARALMENASAAAAKGSAPVCPYTLLLEAYGKAARSRTPGASTAVIVSLDGTTLRWAILGDSAFAVLRGGKVVHRSTPQQHDFNYPFQLRSKGRDRVADADVGVTPVEEGDVVVVGTDGLFDNVFDDELERVVGKGAETGLSPQSMADSIAGAACEMARRRLAHSPFSVESRRRGKKRFYGGKVDDITVVVAFITPV